MEPTDSPETSAVYDRATTILADGSLSYSDRRNRLRVVRRSVGDSAFFGVIESVSVYDSKADITVPFSEYMQDLASTYIGHPEAPISFDPVGAAMRIYFSPTEETIRQMTGIGLGHERVVEYAMQFREAQEAALQEASLAKAAEAQPPAFVEGDENLRSAYGRARAILTDTDGTDETRRQQLRVLQDEVGQETLTLVLRYVPIVDLETKSVQTFDSYMRDMAGSYGGDADSPMDRDPVGATMRIFFDPSPETISAMTGMGLSDSQRQEASRRYETTQQGFAETSRQLLAEAVSRFDWSEVKGSSSGGGSVISSFFGSD